MDIAVLIPCYNEATTIKKVILDFKRVLPEALIYVYDNNSDDGSDILAKEAGAIVVHEYKQGKGNVVRSMFREIDADCYVIVDGDDTYPAESVSTMVQLIQTREADMVIGDRLSSTYFTENKRPFHNMGNRLVRSLINHLFRSDIMDIMTGYRAFSRDFVKAFPVTCQGFEIETEMTVFALDNQLRIKEIPVLYRDRPENSESKINTYRDGARVIRSIVCLFKDVRPLAFFSIVSFFLLSICLVPFTFILLDYLHTGFVKKFPTLIVLSAMGVCAIINFFCGVILSVLKKQHRQNVERFMTMNHRYRNQ